MYPHSRKVIFIDVFKPGSSERDLGDLEDRRAMALLARSTGAHVILGSTRQPGEGEITKLGQSLFAYASCRV